MTDVFNTEKVRIRHPGENRDPEGSAKTWIPASAGMTTRR
jgi:hypothetical protein